MKSNVTTDAIYFRLFMPSVRKENVKVWIEKVKLIAEGKRDKGFVDDKDNYSMRFGVPLPMEIIKANAITSEMKNGSLKVHLPLSIKVRDDNDD
ncbi:26.2 kDa heat shock protein mitochondrial [Phtheirospermum japonicum]|uniref:26.2 kDa heat shock protein mitochondrial n=1 Tax=Phtheirospermum japonicum TaxID=374723 RepID=A0A830CKJ4_9LAMI|nr:26.2 kDa heat shock protein mitochondrial [Phtheirospermum japonicum]